MLFGFNHTKQDVAGAIRKASQCSHPEATWLASTLGGSSSVLEACDALKEPADGGCSRALCFRGLLLGDNRMVEKAAKELFPLALLKMGLLSVASDGAEALGFFERAVELQERDALFSMGRLLIKSKVGSLEMQRDLLMRAANLGNVDAMEMLGLTYSIESPER